VLGLVQKFSVSQSNPKLFDMIIKDYYKTLNVSREATVDEIRREYRKISREHHPDVAKDKKTSASIFMEASEAYEVLSAPEKRRAYDEQLQTLQVENIDDTVKKAVESYLDGLT
jgi:DnaJ-class molecular chaperone